MRRNDVMTSEVEERPRFFMGGYRRHRSQWVKAILLVLILRLCVTMSLNNTRTLKFKAQLTNVHFTAVSQMFGGSS